MEQKILLSLHRKGLHPGQGETPDFSPCRSLSLYADHSPCMQLIDYLPLHAEWGVVDWAPLILLRGTEGNKSSLETCANFRAKNYTPCFLGWREYIYTLIVYSTHELFTPTDGVGSAPANKIHTPPLPTLTTPPPINILA